MVSRHESPPCVLHVCTSCRPPGTARHPKENRPGFQLYEKLREAVRTGPLAGRVEVVPAACISVCPRPCGIALSAAGSWSYLFGDQDPERSVSEILECAVEYLASSDGFMARSARPAGLRSSILGRIPARREGSNATL